MHFSYFHAVAVLLFFYCYLLLSLYICQALCNFGEKIQNAIQNEIVSLLCKMVSCSITRTVDVNQMNNKTQMSWDSYIDEDGYDDIYLESWWGHW